MFTTWLITGTQISFPKYPKVIIYKPYLSKQFAIALNKKFEKNKTVLFSFAVQMLLELNYLPSIYGYQLSNLSYLKTFNRGGGINCPWSPTLKADPLSLSFWKYLLWFFSWSQTRYMYLKSFSLNKNYKLLNRDIPYICFSYLIQPHKSRSLSIQNECFETGLELNVFYIQIINYYFQFYC